MYTRSMTDLFLTDGLLARVRFLGCKGLAGVAGDAVGAAEVLGKRPPADVTSAAHINNRHA